MHPEAAPQLPEDVAAPEIPTAPDLEQPSLEEDPIEDEGHRSSGRGVATEGTIPHFFERAESGRLASSSNDGNDLRSRPLRGLCGMLWGSRRAEPGRWERGPSDLAPRRRCLLRHVLAQQRPLACQHHAYPRVCFSRLEPAPAGAPFAAP